MKKRGQAATEFLTTYGWAAIILIIVIITVISLGVFNPKAPNVCNSNSPIFCSDVKLTSSNTITLALSSSGTSIKTSPDLRTKISSIDLTGPIVTSCSGAVFMPDNIVPTDGQKSISCTLSGTFKKGLKFSGTASINYYLQETESNPLQHTAKITFSGLIE